MSEEPVGPLQELLAGSTDESDLEREVLCDLFQAYRDGQLERATLIETVKTTGAEFIAAVQELIKVHLKRPFGTQDYLETLGALEDAYGPLTTWCVCSRLGRQGEKCSRCGTVLGGLRMRTLDVGDALPLSAFRE